MAVLEDRTTQELPRFARWPVLGIAAVIGALLTAVSGRYGHFGDELYFVGAGRHLDWGYADQPPLLPLIARAMDVLAPGSLVVLRAPATLVTMLGIVLAALVARELGGRAMAQALAAAAYAASPFLLTTGHLLATSTFDPMLWTLLTWLVVRWVRTRDDRLLLAAGVATAVALQVKGLVVAFWVVLLLAALAVGPRDLLRRPLLWAGAGIAGLATVPTLLWQATHGWPQLGMGRVIAAEGAYVGGAAWFVPLGIVSVGFVAGSVLAGYGLVRLLRSPDLAPYRFLAWWSLGVVAVFAVSGGRPYYLAGAFPVLWAAGAVELGRAARWWRWVASLPAFVLTLGVLLTVNVLPIAPIEARAGEPLVIGDFQRDEFGWDRYVDDVAAVYTTLPQATAERTVLLASSYWGAGALEYFGPDRGLPTVAYSPHRGYGYFPLPPEAATAAVFLGTDPGPLRELFREVRQAGAVDNDADVANLAQGTAIWVLEGRTAPWAEVWSRIRTL